MWESGDKNGTDDGVFLSLKQEHYLKRELLKLQIDREVEGLADFNNIGIFGYPFIDHNNPSKYADGFEKFPILRHIFLNYIKSFPFVSSASDAEFWQGTVQPFLEGFASKGISSSEDREEASKRQRMGRKLKRMILIYCTSGIQTIRGSEKQVSVNTAARGLQSLNKEELLADLKESNFVNGYDISIVGVRRSSVRRGFLYEYQWSQFEGAPPIFVARKYSDFIEFNKKLRKEFPGKSLPKLPSKHRSAGTYNDDEDDIVDDNMSEGISLSVDSYEDGDSIESNNESKDIGEGVKKLGLKTKKSVSNLLKPLSSPKQVPSKQEANNHRQVLPRERQRVTLRSYTRNLLEFPEVTRSQPFMEFYFKNKIAKLCISDLHDMDRRRQMDLIRLEQQLKFFEIASARARDLEGYLSEFKRDILQKDGLFKLFQEVKAHATVEQLSPRVRKFVEWAVIEVAATLYHMFVADDSAPEMFSQVRRIHHLFPYMMLRGILKWSNPVAMMKAVIDLFLAQPFGKRSLLQSLFWMILEDDIKAQQKLIAELRSMINNSELTEVIDSYVDSSYDVKEKMNSLARANKCDIVATIFSHSSLFSRSSWAESIVSRWHEEWEKAAEGDSRVKTSQVDSYTRLKEYYLLAVRRHDKDQMQQFWADDTVVHLIKNLVTLFYGPLIKIFKMANLHESVTDVERFMNDLISVIERTRNSDLDPNHTVQEFIALCERHQNNLFKFIHNVYVNDDGLFDEITKWIARIIEFLRYGNGKKLDIEALLLQEADINVSKVVQEIDALIEWTDQQRQWKKASEKSSTSKLDQLWEHALPSAGLETSDFGMNEDDLDNLNESDEDDEDEDYDSMTLEAEKRRRKRLVQKLSAKSTVSRPIISEIPRLQASFHQVLVDMFHE